MRQLTIRGFDPELEHHIRGVARQQGISLNRAVLQLLRKGAGLEAKSDDAGAIGSTLDDLIGTWSEDEAAELDRALSDFDTIDEEMWR